MNSKKLILFGHFLRVHLRFLLRVKHICVIIRVVCEAFMLIIYEPIVNVSKTSL